MSHSKAPRKSFVSILEWPDEAVGGLPPPASGRGQPHCCMGPFPAPYVKTYFTSRIQLQGVRTYRSYRYTSTLSQPIPNIHRGVCASSQAPAALIVLQIPSSTLCYRINTTEYKCKYRYVFGVLQLPIGTAITYLTVSTHTDKGPAMLLVDMENQSLTRVFARTLVLFGALFLVHCIAKRGLP